ASNSGSPSGSAPAPRPGSRPRRRVEPSPPAGPGSSPSPPPRSGPPCRPGSPRPGTPSRRPPRRAPTQPPSPPGPPPAAIVSGSVPPAAPLSLDPVEARYHRFESPLEDQTRGRQRRPAVIGQGAAHGGAVAPHHLRLRVVAALDLPLHPPRAADLLLQLLLGAAIGLEDRLGCLTKVMEVAELVGHAVERLLDGLTDRALAVGDRGRARHRQRLLDLGDEPGQVVLRRGQEAPGQE